jgi:hypothetical protein
LGSKLLGEAIAEADGTWLFSFTVPMSEGAFELHSAVLDAIGNKLASSRPLGFRVLAPVVVPQVVLPDAGEVVAGVVLLQGTAAPGARLVIYDGDTPLGETIADDDGAWVFRLADAWTAGTHALRAVVVKDTGEALAESQVVEIEATGPEPTPTLPLVEK